MFVSDIIEILEEWAPIEYSEDFDNVGLLTGDPKSNCTGVLITLDTIESIIDEAIKNKCNLIVSFHPIIFSSLKKISKSDYVQKTIWQRLKIICEPSCSLPLAGIIKNKDEFKGKKIGVVITGGNIDLDNLPF